MSKSSEVSEIRDTVIEVKNTLETYRDVLIGLGINVDGCSPEKLLETVTTYSKNIYLQINDTLDSITSRIGGNFLVTIGLLLANLVGARALAWVDSVITEYIFGKFLGTLNSLVAAITNLLPGAELIFQYYAITHLKKTLEIRVKLLTVIIADLDAIIKIFLEIRKILINTRISKMPDNVKFEDLNKVIAKLQQAINLMHNEIIVNMPRTGTVKVSNLIKADSFIKEAINLLFGNEEFTKNLNVNATSTFNNLAEYSAKTALDISNDYKKTVATMESTAKSLTFEKNVLPVLAETFPLLPAVLKYEMIKETIKPIIAGISKIMPVNTMGSDPGPLDITSIVDRNFKGFNEMVGHTSEVLKIKKEPAAKVSDYSSFTSTFREYSDTIKIYESTILLFPSMWIQVKKIGKMYLPLVEVTRDNVQTIKQNIADTVDSLKASKGTFGANNLIPFKIAAPINSISNAVMDPTIMLAKKQFWATELVLARATLKPIISSNAELNIEGKKINMACIADTIAEAGIISSKLKDMITSKILDKKKPVGQQGKKDLALYAVDSSQSVFPKLLLGQALLLSPGFFSKVIGELQSLRFALDKIKKDDTKEILICREFIDLIDRTECTRAAKEALDKFIAGLNGSPLADYADKLAKGSLADIVGIAEGIQAVADIADVAICAEATKGGIIEDMVGVLKLQPLNKDFGEKLDKLSKTISSVMNSLQDKINFLAKFMTEINSMVAKVMELKNKVPKIKPNITTTQSQKQKQKLNTATGKTPEQTIMEIIQSVDLMLINKGGMF